MKKNAIFLLAFQCIFCLCSVAQESPKGEVSASNSAVQPFQFSVHTLTGEAPRWNLFYSGGYGQRTAGPFGYDGVDQQFAVKGYLGHRLTLYANAMMGFSGGQITSAQQAEVIHDFVGGKRNFGPRLGLGLGVSRDWSDVKAVFSRVTAYFENATWRLGGNLRLEKAFAESRDGIDVITSAGFHHRITGRLFGGVEMVGQDLEGFWEKDEAEGGAKLLIGPSLNLAPAGSKFTFSICGGPVFYATHSTVMPSEALRDLDIFTDNGYTVRAMVGFSL